MTALPVAFSRRFSSLLFKSTAAIFSVILVAGTFAAPPTAVLDDTQAAVRAVLAVQSQVTPDLMRQPEILGTAVGVDAAGTPVLTVYVDRDAPNGHELIRNLPRQIGGVSVQAHQTDKFRAMSVIHTAKQTPPIQLGTPGGNSIDLANGFCCGGTLGSLVKIGSTEYILSNYHVFESDIVSGVVGLRKCACSTRNFNRAAQSAHPPLGVRPWTTVKAIV
jgi:hypothetical protein